MIGPVLERLLPSFVAWSETREDRLDVELFPEEALSLGRPVEKRRREFVTSRACARKALVRLGAPVVAIPNGEHGEPLWPPGVVGSITHCDGYRACAVASSDAIAALGIDAEPNLPLPEGVLEEVTHGRELELISARTGQVDAGRLIFSAKEAVYKAWFPLARRWLGFDEVELSVDLEGGEFSARLLVSGPIVGGAPLTELRGRWGVEEAVVCTAVIVPADSRSAPLPP
jgi:4'-phosphopantetheinyl transferase EntD